MSPQLLIDTHCHIHEHEYFTENREDVYEQSRTAGVAMICVGTSVQSSREALEFCRSHKECYPVVGIHPHEAKHQDVAQIRKLVEEYRSEIVGIGEIGLDYYYSHSPRDSQLHMLRAQLQIAKEYDLPVSFHIRDALPENSESSVWADFWPLLDEFPGIRGVLHSFTDTYENYLEAKKRGLYIGVNGISTFTKDESQQKFFTEVPLEDIVLETDAPFLTPKPFRGTMNIPAYVGRVAEHQAMLKNVSPTDVIRVTTANAKSIFGI